MRSALSVCLGLALACAAPIGALAEADHAGTPMMQGGTMMMQGGSMMEDGPMHGGPMMGGCDGGMGAGHQTGPAAMNHRLVELENALKLSDSQHGDWQAYAAAMEDYAQSMHHMSWRGMMMKSHASPVDVVDDQIRYMQNMVEALSAVRPPLRRLYASLNAEQKQIAADRLWGPCTMMW